MRPVSRVLPPSTISKFHVAMKLAPGPSSRPPPCEKTIFSSGTISLNVLLFG
jgi:hypothetical protein